MKRYNQTRKEKVISKVRKGEPLRRVARVHRIPRSTVWNWCKKAGLTDSS